MSQSKPGQTGFQCIMQSASGRPSHKADGLCKSNDICHAWLWVGYIIFRCSGDDDAICQRLFDKWSGEKKMQSCPVGRLCGHLISDHGHWSLNDQADPCSCSNSAASLLAQRLTMKSAINCSVPFDIAMHEAQHINNIRWYTTDLKTGPICLQLFKCARRAMHHGIACSDTCAVHAM